MSCKLYYIVFSSNINHVPLQYYMMNSAGTVHAAFVQHDSEKDQTKKSHNN